MELKYDRNRKRIIKLLKGYKNYVLILFISFILTSLLSFCLPLVQCKLMDDGFIGGNINQIIYLTIVLVFLNF